ncbi:MAG: sortase [Gaiellaceae bacterium]
MAMRHVTRWLGTILIVAGVLSLAWALLIWRWQDPFTALYTSWQQRELRNEYQRQLEDFHPPPAPVGTGRDLARYELSIADAARRYRRGLHEGQAIGRIVVPRLGLHMVFVNGTQEQTLKEGPGRERSTFMPGEGKLIYIAGHRTTYQAPFSAIDKLRPGDSVKLEVPYGTFEYRITGHRIVPANNLAVLKSRGREVVALQACHPRFFASERYIAYARPVRVVPRTGPAYQYTGTELSATGRPKLPQ